MTQPGFFDVDERLTALSAAGDPLERLSAVVDFELFRSVLDSALARSDRSRGGRPPYDPVLMFKVLVLQALYSLSDDAVEFQIRDRLSFMRFLGLGLGDRVPDAKTIWLFREQLVRAGAMEKLFERFDAALHGAGYLAMGGQIIDATVVAAPRQKLTDAEKATVRSGGTPSGWSEAKRRQKDLDARWTIKRGRSKRSEASEMQTPGVAIAVPVFGYKNHLGIDRRHGFVRRWTVTHAAAHDSRPFEGLLDPHNTASKVWADTAYRSARNEAAMAKRGRVSMVHFRKPKGRPLPGPHAKANAARSAVRSAIEHVFAGQKHRMKLFVRTVGLARAKLKIGMANLTYNFSPSPGSRTERRQLNRGDPPGGSAKATLTPTPSRRSLSAKAGSLTPAATTWMKFFELSKWRSPARGSSACREPGEAQLSSAGASPDDASTEAREIG